MTIPASTSVGRLYLESRHLPAAQGGGGDIHDAMATPFGIRLLIGDVMGTGPAAHRTGLCVLNAWRELACAVPSLASIAVRLHALIAQSEDPERFVTALLVNFPATVDLAGPASGSWAELVCCGHPAPLLLRGGSAAFVEPHPAPPLGLLDLADGRCQASMFPVGMGEALLLYTDGVSEARDAAGRFFPLAERTAQALLPSGPAPDGALVLGVPEGTPVPGEPDGIAGPHLLDALVASLHDHVGGRVRDDVLLLMASMRLTAGRSEGLRPRPRRRAAGLVRAGLTSRGRTGARAARPAAMLR